MELHDNLCDQTNIAAICGLAIEVAALISIDPFASAALKDSQLLLYKQTTMLQPFGLSGPTFRAQTLAKVVQNRSALVHVVTQQQCGSALCAAGVWSLLTSVRCARSERLQGHFTEEIGRCQSMQLYLMLQSCCHCAWQSPLKRHDPGQSNVQQHVHTQVP